MSMTSRRMKMATAGGGAPEFIYTLQGNFSSPQNVSSLALAAGWNGDQALRVVLDGCKILSNAVTSPALDLRGTYPNGIILEPKTNTVIMGRGGSGQAGAGGPAGHAAIIDTDITIHLDSSNIANSASAVAFLGGGGGGGAAVLRDRDRTSKSTSYQYVYFYGGGGCGGGSNGYQTGPSLVGYTSQLGTSNGSAPSALAYTLYTPDSSGAIPNGFGVVGVMNSASGELSSSFYVYGNVGGTTVPTSPLNQGFPYFYSNPTTNGWIKLGNVLNYSSTNSVTQYAPSGAAQGQMASGGGGGYGSNGGQAYATSNFSSSDHVTGYYAAGVGGRAIAKTSSTNTVTFTGDILPSSNFFSTNYAVFLGGIT